MLSVGSQSGSEAAAGKKAASGNKAGAKKRNGDRFASQFTDKTASTRLPGAADECEKNAEQAQDDGDFGEEDEWVSDSEGNVCDDMLDCVKPDTEGTWSKEAGVAQQRIERIATFADSFENHMCLLRQVMQEQGFGDDTDLQEDDSEEQSGDLVNDMDFFDSLRAEAFPSFQLLVRRLNSENYDVVEDTGTPKCQPTRQPRTQSRSWRRLPACPEETSQGSVAAPVAPRRLSAWPLCAELLEEQDEAENDHPHHEQQPLAPRQPSAAEDSEESSNATTTPSKTGEGAPASAPGARSPDTDTYASSTSRDSSSKGSHAPVRGNRYYTPSTEALPTQPQPPAAPRLGAAPPSRHVLEGSDEAAASSGAGGSMTRMRTSPASLAGPLVGSGIAASSSSLPANLGSGEEDGALGREPLGETPHAGSISSALRRRIRSLT